MYGIAIAVADFSGNYNDSIYLTSHGLAIMTLGFAEYIF